MAVSIQHDTSHLSSQHPQYNILRSKSLFHDPFPDSVQTPSLNQPPKTSFIPLLASSTSLFHLHCRLNWKRK